MSGLPYVATLLTALGCGLVAGIFFAFSSFVIAGLRRLPAAQGIAAMQSINVLALTSLFMAALFGTAVACLGLIVAAVASSGGWPLATVLAGTALYLLGTIGVTMAANVPLNNLLAALDPQSAAAAEHWRTFVARWTAWNHVRTLAAFAAAALLTVALKL